MDLRTKIIEVFAVLILIAESAWCFQLTQISLPTVQSERRYLLFNSPGTEEQKQKSSCRQKGKDLFLAWKRDANGSELTRRRLDGHFDGALRRIPVPSKKSWDDREDTLPGLKNRFSSCGYLEISEFSRRSPQWLSLSRRKSFIATSLVQMTRYTWLGCNRASLLLWSLTEWERILFLSSVADNVEILSFLEATGFSCCCWSLP